MSKQLLRNKQYQDQSSLPPEEQKEWQNLQLYKDLGALQDRNETLFYRFLMDDFKRLAPIIYTPTVGQACLKSHHIYRQARGMYFSMQDRGHFSSMTYNWPHDVKVIVVTDGSRVLGLGDLGCNGMPIPVGKLALYVAAGGLSPHSVLPVVLDVGTNNKLLREDPLYLGTPVERLVGKEYYDLIDEWMHAIYSRWPRVLVQFEDFKNPHAQEILSKYRDKFCCFNDDIQSTGAITLSGIFSSLKARGFEFKDLVNERIVCVGAGSAGVGVCETIVEAMVRLGSLNSKTEAYSKFCMLDQYGLLGESRPREHLTDTQIPYQRTDMPNGLSLLEVVKRFKPTVLLGLSGAGGVFTRDVIEEMSQLNQQPVIFPLSNPTKNSECSAQQACEWSGGRALFASGSPFDDIEDGTKTFFTSQCNNYYIYPGMGLGITTCQSASVPDSFFQVLKSNGRKLRWLWQIVRITRKVVACSLKCNTFVRFLLILLCAFVN
jgi:malate dehydrogenase (oxaloacetate-decarboxylating)(NADP+)